MFFGISPDKKHCNWFSLLGFQTACLISENGAQFLNSSSCPLLYFQNDSPSPLLHIFKITPLFQFPEPKNKKTLFSNFPNDLLTFPEPKIDPLSFPEPKQAMVASLLQVFRSTSFKGFRFPPKIWLLSNILHETRKAIIVAIFLPSFGSKRLF